MLLLTGIRPEFSREKLAVNSTGAGIDMEILDHLKRLDLQFSDLILTLKTQSLTRVRFSCSISTEFLYSLYL